MEKNILDKTHVLKDIDSINLYANEEYVKLSKIFNTFNSCTSSYKTTNTTQMSRKNSSLKANVTVLKANRDEYTKVLKKAVKIYDDTAAQFVASAKKQEAKMS